MKKAIFLGLILAFAVPFISHAAFDSNLKYGSSNTAVKEMQEFLVDQGVCNITPTGNFFSLTLSCVKAFQAKEGISPVSGYWGPLTRAKASEKLDLSASDTAEASETGTVTTPTSTDNFAQLLAILTGIKQATEQNNQVQNPAPQPVQNTPVVETPAATVNPVEVPFDKFGWLSILPDKKYAFVGAKNVLQGDILTLTFDGVETTKTLGDGTNRLKEYYFEVGDWRSGGTLIPNTEYTFTMKLQRGNEYAITSGVFKTLAE